MAASADRRKVLITGGVLSVIMIAMAVLGVWIFVRGGTPPIIQAVRQRDHTHVDELLAKKVDVNSQDSKGKTALHTAIDLSHKGIYRKLLENGADPNICDSVGTSVVHLAAEQSDSFWLQEALEHGGDPNRLNEGSSFAPGRTPLFYAISYRQSESGVLLINAGADVNCKDGHGETPLFFAMGAGMYDLMVAMIEVGADPTAKLGHDQSVTLLDLWKFDEDYESLVSHEKRESYRKLRAILIEKGFLSAE